MWYCIGVAVNAAVAGACASRGYWPAAIANLVAVVLHITNAHREQSNERATMQRLLRVAEASE